MSNDETKIFYKIPHHKRSSIPVERQIIEELKMKYPDINISLTVNEYLKKLLREF